MVYVTGLEIVCHGLNTLIGCKLSKKHPSSTYKKIVFEIATIITYVRSPTHPKQNFIEVFFNDFVTIGFKND